MRLRLILRYSPVNEAPKHLIITQPTDARFVVGAVLALSVVVAFVLILHFA